jgi:prepilin-type processing-associated H-X9-DG protein
LSMWRDRSQRMRCLSNLKQLQTGWLMYLDDNQDTMPPNRWDGIPGSDAGSAPGSWTVGNARDTSPTNIQIGVQWRYHPSLAIYHCPTDKSLTRDGAMARFRSYSLLNFLGADPGDIGPTASRNRQRGSDLKHTSTVLAFTCEDSGSINDGILFIYPPPSTEWKDVPGFRHSHGCSGSFTDGHAEYWKWKSGGLPNDQEDLTRVQAALPEP